MARAMSGVQIKCRKRINDLILLLFLNEITDQLGLANSVFVYCHVLRRAID